ncbi:MAG: outer membrane beta-barrel protein [Ferruginibacter sp.]
MRKSLVLLCAVSAYATAFSQIPGGKKKYDLGNRPGDHFLFQINSNQWSGTPDSIDRHMGSFNRSANLYLMLDKPFKSDPRFSIAIGLGIGNSSIYFKNMNVDIASTNGKLPFNATDSTNHFKKYKLSTAFLEIPLELRFSSNPEKPMKSVKVALGLKAGTLLSAKTKGKTLQNASGTTLNNYTQKIISKSYFNSTRVGATARIGYGNFTLSGAYYFNPIFKDGVAADVKLYQIGLTLSGL